MGTHKQARSKISGNGLEPAQLSFAFSQNADASQRASPIITPQQVREILNDQYPRYLEDPGYTVFTVPPINDPWAIEGDSGSPAYGIDFFAKLINTARSFRYTHLKHIDGVYKTHYQEAEVIGRYHSAQGYHLFDKLTPDQYPSYIHFSNGGITRAFKDTVDFIMDGFSKTRKTHLLFGDKKYKGVILVPAPTYGLFLATIRQHQPLTTGLELRFVPRHDNGAVDQHALKMIIADCNLRGLRIAAYYDSNPNNPSGHIRDEAETRAIAHILAPLAHDYHEQDMHFLQTLSDDRRETPAFRQLANAFIEGENRILLLDDMAYEGLEFSNDKKPFSFAQVSPDVAGHTVVFKSLSKIGLPGLRIGLTIAHSSLIKKLADLQLDHEFSASAIGVDILSARYTEGPHQKNFSKHLVKLKSAHMWRAGVIEAFVNGLDNTDKLSRNQKQQLIKDYAKFADIDHANAQTRLKRGLPQFSVRDDLEAGFFMMLDCPSLRGREIAIRQNSNSTASTYAIENSRSLYWVFRLFGIATVPASAQGTLDNRMETRITLSLTQPELFTMFDRLRAMHDHFFAPTAGVQLKLFDANRPKGPRKSKTLRL